MTLLKVEYEFFDFEDPSSDAKELGRQLRLQFSDAPTLYLSWTSERHCETESQPYSIACSKESYFMDGAAHVVDASDSPLWSKHIGRQMELAYLPSQELALDHQVLEVRSDTHRTFVYSLGADRVGLSLTSPLEGRFLPGR